MLTSFYCSLPTFATEFHAKITDPSTTIHLYFHIYEEWSYSNTQDTNSTVADVLHLLAATKGLFNHFP